MEKTVDAAAVVMLIENNWAEFVEYSGDEESAQMSLDALKAEAGMA